MLNPCSRLRNPNPPEIMTAVPTGNAANGTWYGPKEDREVTVSISLARQPAPNVAYA